MFCSHCGKELDAGASFCKSCGRPQGRQQAAGVGGTPADSAVGLTRQDFLVIAGLVMLSLLLILIIAVT